MICMLKMNLDFFTARMILRKAGYSLVEAEKYLSEIYGDDDNRIVKVLFNFDQTKPFEGDGLDTFVWPSEVGDSPDDHGFLRVSPQGFEATNPIMTQNDGVGERKMDRVKIGELGSLLRGAQRTATG